MGSLKMRLTNPNYLIHGTNREGGIGRRVSHGCINMFNADVEQLYRLTAIGTPVSIVHEPYKAGWKDGYLWIEVHQPLEDYRTAINDYSLNHLMNVTEKVAQSPTDVEWSLVKRGYKHTRGIPMVVGNLK
jgi:L,D-transpeptidase ErfK/SrfK